MSLEEFARIHNLGSAWVELRQECNRIVEQADFWYRKELQAAAQQVAVKASDMFVATANRANSFPCSIAGTAP